MICLLHCVSEQTLQLFPKSVLHFLPKCLSHLAQIHKNKEVLQPTFLHHYTMSAVVFLLVTVRSAEVQKFKSINSKRKFQKEVWVYQSNYK